MAKKSFQENLIQKLDNNRSTNPNEFRKTLNSIKQTNFSKEWTSYIDPKTWFKYFTKGLNNDANSKDIDCVRNEMIKTSLGTAFAEVYLNLYLTYN